MMTGVYAHNPEKAAEVSKTRSERLAAKRAKLAARLARMTESTR